VHERESTRVSSYLDRRDEARREFRRICLSSLAATSEAELRERHRTKHLLRSHRSERRLAERRRLLAELDAPTWLDRSTSHNTADLLTRVVPWLLAVSVPSLGWQVAVSGVDSSVTAAGDAAMLVLALLWFFLPLLGSVPQARERRDVLS
jgi:hypothetical protein